MTFNPPSQKLQFLFFVAWASLIVSACGLMNNDLAVQSSANRIIKLTRLPTLTPTPLPTLTPTPDPALAAATNPVESNAAVPTATPSPAPVDAAPPPTVPMIEPSFPPATVADEQNQPDGNDAIAAVDLPLEETAPPAVTETPTLPPIETPTLPLIETATPSSPPTVPALPTPISEIPGWTFVNVQVYDDLYEDGLLVYGELVNNTGTVQELAYITGTFFDEQGQVIADENSTGDYWPVKLIPPDGRLPFGIFVDGIYSAANFDLTVEAYPSNETLHQNFEFSVDDQWQNDEEYCLEGQVRSVGDSPQSYVVVVMVLYDDQDKVITFGESHIAQSYGGSLDFDICVELFAHNVAHHELRAWGE